MVAFAINTKENMRGSIDQKRTIFPIVQLEFNRTKIEKGQLVALQMWCMISMLQRKVAPPGVDHAMINNNNSKHGIPNTSQVIGLLDLWQQICASASLTIRALSRMKWSA